MQNLARLISVFAISTTFLAEPSFAAEPSLQDLQNQEESALKAYEAARANRLSREIAEEEKSLVLKKAELAKLAGSPAPAAAPVASEPTAVAALAKTAAETQTKITSEKKSEDGKSETVSAEPYSPDELRDGGPTREFGGIKFGIGIAYTLDTGKYQRVTEAEVVNNIVRVKQSQQSSARIVLESHYFLTPTWNGLNNFMHALGVGTNEYLPDKADPKVKKLHSNWGLGPFVALQPGTDNVIDAIGTGIMIGARRSNAGNDSFNLGLGVMVDINARTLGNGIVEDQPLPEGDMIRYKERSQLGVLLMSSYSF